MAPEDRCPNPTEEIPDRQPTHRRPPAQTGGDLPPPRTVEVGLQPLLRRKQALHDINLTIPERFVTAFIGPSGCGKSTLLRCFNRMNDLIDDVRIEGRAAASTGLKMQRRAPRT